MMTTAEMQKRFHDLSRQREEIIQRLAPLQADVDARVAKIEAEKAALAPIAQALATAKAPLFALDNERAALSRALNGKVGAA